MPTGEYEDFATGFVLSDATVWGRPVRNRLTVAAAASLLMGQADNVERVRGGRHVWMDVRRHAQSVRPRTDGRRIVRRLGRGACGEFYVSLARRKYPPRQNVARPRRANPRPGQPMKASMCARSSERLSGQDEPSGYALKAEDIFW
jgi:hypothetical protein